MASETTKKRVAFQNSEDSPLAKFDDTEDDHVLDDAEQEKVVRDLKEHNDKANTIYRWLNLFILSLVAILYVTPLPAYLTGTHPENHLTLFLPKGGMTQGTVEDLIHLPAAPIYIFFMGISFALLWGAAKETLERVGIIKLRGVAFPAAPSQFGTAPAWLVPSLSDIRFHPSHVDPSARADEHTGPTVASAVQPRLLYLIVLWIASLPLPLLTFGTGSFLNSFWWSATPAAILVLILTEWMISKGEKEVQSLSGLKYSYKGA